MISKLLGVVPPGGKPYCEPFCGAASLFFAREPAPVEVLNDLNGDIVNFFRCLQNKETFEELRHRISYTPYARAEFTRALEIVYSDCEDPVDRAWAFFVAQNQSVGGTGALRGRKLAGYNWGRTFTSQRYVAHTVNSWLMRISMLDAFRWRLMHAQIDCRDAIEVIKYWDNDEAVFYIDPPYLDITRVDKKVYTYEPDKKYHEGLVRCLTELKGYAVLSCYDHEMYHLLLEHGWAKKDYKTVCHAAGKIRGSSLVGSGGALKSVPRIETIYYNYRVKEYLKSDKSDTRPLNLWQAGGQYE